MPSSNDKILYTLVSLISHYGNSLDFGHCVSDVFDTDKGIWCHCDDENINQISDLVEGVYIRESNQNKRDVRLKRCIIFVLYQKKQSDKIQIFVFNNSPTCPKSII